MSASSNESFVVVSKESQDKDGNQITHMFKPLVTFENVLVSYPLELDLLVRVTFDESYKKISDETFLLIPVGCTNIKEEHISLGNMCNNIVQFPMDTLPKEEEECQFCYYNEEHESVLGLSKPFTLEKFKSERLIQFIDDEDYALLLNTFEKGMAKLEKQDTTSETNESNKTQPSESEVLENDSQLIQQVTREVIRNLNKNWISEKESLLTELKDLKESVEKLQKMNVSSDSDSSDSECSHSTKIKNIPVIYGITPTYARPEQKAILTRLTHTLRLIPCFHWIVVEDAAEHSHVVSDILSKSGLSFTHLVDPSPRSEKRIIEDSEYAVQRNAALRWLRRNKQGTGIVYFLDEYKIYSLEIFNEMRTIQKVGVWPVGLAGGLLAEKPIVDTQTGRVIAWNTQWRRDRRFPIDAIGCAINLKHLIANPNAEFSLEVEPALRLSAFLSKLVSENELEPKASYCSEIYVWHIRIQPVHIK